MLSPGAVSNTGGSATITGTVIVEPLAVATITRSSVAASLVSVTLLAANAGRRGAVIRNTAPGRLFVTLGAAAATTANAAYELTQGSSIPIPDQHTYEIRGIWTGGVGGVASLSEAT